MRLTSRRSAPRDAVRWLTVMTAIWASPVLGALATPGAAGAASACVANSTLAGSRSYLPDCRAYEQVSPSYKGGGVPQELLTGESVLSTDGNHVLANVLAGFAGSENDERNGSQAGAVYVFSRTVSGWQAEALDPPAYLTARSGVVAASSDLSSSLWEFTRQAQPGEEVLSEEVAHTLWRRERGTEGRIRFVEVGPEDALGFERHSFAFGGASRDLNHVVFGVTNEQAHWPGDGTVGSVESLYEYSGAAQREPALVGVSNSGPLSGSSYRNEHASLISVCGTELGAPHSEGGDTFNAVSASGGAVFFTALRGECEPPAVNELYARIDGSATVAISEPALTPGREQECSGTCLKAETEVAKRKPATFQGASEDGTKVFFTTTQPLLNSDTDEGRDLYEAEVDGSAITHLTMVSKGDPHADPTPGEHAGALGVATVSQDGSHVYFLARGVLAPATPRGEAAQAGGYNLYDYDTRKGSTSLVAVLLSAAEATALEAPYAEELHIKKAECERLLGEGKVEAARACEAELAALGESIGRKVESAAAPVTGYLQKGVHRFETTPNGRYLIFESPRDLTGAEDTSTVTQLFEYDSGSGALSRVSAGPLPGAGNTSNPADVPRMLYPNDTHGATPTASSAQLSLSNDGRVYFTSARQLLEQAAQGSENVYEFSPSGVGGCAAPVVTGGGCLSLVSPGAEGAPEEPGNRPRLLGVDQAGSDVFFSSTANLLPGKADSQLEWYDARAGGGFPAGSLPSQCESACANGSASSQISLPSPGGSATSPGGEPLSSPTAIAPQRRPLSRAQKLARALGDCRKRHGRRRRTCERLAKKTLGGLGQARRKTRR